jgi:hypothetical protein
MSSQQQDREQDRQEDIVLHEDDQARADFYALLAPIRSRRQTNSTCCSSAPARRC